LWAAALAAHQPRSPVRYGSFGRGSPAGGGSSLIKLAGDVEITGKLKVDGATTVQDITINGAESGGGPT